jgi:hypothetical protein
MTRYFADHVFYEAQEAVELWIFSSQREESSVVHHVRNL